MRKREAIEPRNSYKAEADVVFDTAGSNAQTIGKNAQVPPGSESVASAQGTVCIPGRPDAFRKYDENQKNYISGCTDLPWAIPKTVTDAQVDIIGIVVEALSAKNYAGVLPVYFETVMKARIADSPDDAEMLQIIADGRTISFAMQYGLEYYNTLKELIVGRKEVASFYQGLAEAAQGKLDTLIESFDEWD